MQRASKDAFIRIDGMNLFCYFSISPNGLVNVLCPRALVQGGYVSQLHVTETARRAGFAGPEIAEMVALREWLNINAYRNVRLLVAGCHEFKIPVSVVWDRLPLRLRELSLAEMRKQEESISLREYDDLLAPLIEALGHVGWLRFVGRCSPKIDFGYEAFKRIVGTNPITGRFVTPWAAYAELNEAAGSWNRNKAWIAYPTKINAVRLSCIYVPGGPQQQTVNRLQDAPSLLHLIRGMNEALPAIFPGRKLARVEYKLVELPIVPLLKMWMTETEIEFDGHTLQVAGEPCGHIVWLQEDVHGNHIGAYSSQEIPNAPMGIRLTQDIQTPSKVTRPGHTLLPLVHAGEIYQIDDAKSPFGRTVVEVEWNLTVFDRVFGFLMSHRRKAFARAIRDETRMIAGGHEAARDRRELDIVRSVTGAVYPDKTFLEEIVRGGNPRIADPQTVSLVGDIIGFSGLTATMEDPVAVAEFMQPFMTGFNQIADHNLGKVNNFTGDGGFVIWNGRLGPSKTMEVQDRIHLAIKAAIELAQLADFVAHPMRFGISVGQTVTYAIPVDSTGMRTFPVTSGDAMTLAKRVEDSMKAFQNSRTGKKRSLIGIDGRCIELLKNGGINIPSYIVRVGEMTEKTDTFVLYQIFPPDTVAEPIQEIAQQTSRVIKLSSDARIRPVTHH